ncbi:YbgC/FadM family acyl-CoA thioesterase [Novosphingobium sp.]|uniref:YbgC/FadM family acyl-CoA thioesterase n=1 Tax=Novosphingobium sp. TaxID=1874826 RepID=UPI00286B1F85|nr:YbgC/FadM family acyl-CoA thioesterase [Novosphingobium sp.]
MTSFPPFPEGLIDGQVHRFAVRAYFEDTDLSGAVYHANYLRWFERARSDFVRLLGIDQRAANESGAGAFAVADLSIRYRAPARLDDGVLIETIVTDLRAASCRMQQKAYHEDGRLLSDATFRVGFVAPDGRPRRMPDGWRAAFAKIALEGNA